MTKEALLEYLQKMINTEETAIGLYSEYIEDALFFAPFAPSKKTEIASYLEKLDAESKEHSVTFKNLIKKIERSHKNVY